MRVRADRPINPNRPREQAGSKVQKMRRWVTERVEVLSPYGTSLPFIASPKLS